MLTNETIATTTFNSHVESVCVALGSVFFRWQIDFLDRLTYDAAYSTSQGHKHSNAVCFCN